MGKKSRLKRERKAKKKLLYPLKHSLPINQMKNDFQKNINQMKSLFQKYKYRDVAVAIGVSDLWPMNAASPIKHILAWTVLLRLSEESSEAKTISKYEEFKSFLTELYKIWPSFPMLEDYSPEADWGQIKVRLGLDYASIFYGSVIERTPDFIEAFRITYAGNEKAIADMNLAIAIQNSIINSIPDLCYNSVPESRNGHIEIPPKEFWQSSIKTFEQIKRNVKKWLSSTSKELKANFGILNDKLTESSFSNSVMKGQALPFMCINEGDIFLPISVRSLPSVVIDYWARKGTSNDKKITHKTLGNFVSERFQQVYAYNFPIEMVINEELIKDFPISCIVAAKTGLYLICAQSPSSYKNSLEVSKNIYTTLSNEPIVLFLTPDKHFLSLSKNGNHSLSIKDIHILFVVEQTGTEFGFFESPKLPARALPMSDFVTIFDSINDFCELEYFWEYIDGQRKMLSPFSRAALVDLFASFRDTHGVLIDGAIKPSMVMIDPHWGTRWRFNTLSTFWSKAPKKFPDGSNVWSISEHSEGTQRLESISKNTLAYSTQIGICTVQTSLTINLNLQIEDARMSELFIDLLIDNLYRNRDVITTLPFIQQSHLVFHCEVDTQHVIISDDQPKPIKYYPRVVLSVRQTQENIFFSKVSSQAILAGLNNVKDASFEIRCLIEVLQECHKLKSLVLPDEIITRLQERASGSARYHLKTMKRHVDVPDYVDPVIPTPMEYKQARKQLAISIQSLGLEVGRYELAEAKDKIDVGRNSLRAHIEERLSSLNRKILIKKCIEQHDAALIAERLKIMKVRHSLEHSVDYNRLELVEETREKFGTAALNYRYLLEKTVSFPSDGTEPITDNVLRELIGLVDWYKVLADASDTLHNEVSVGGINIDESYIPEVFYSDNSKNQKADFTQEYAKKRLGIGINDEDKVDGNTDALLKNEQFHQACIQDLGVNFPKLLAALNILSQAQRYGFSEELSLSYTASLNDLITIFMQSIDNISKEEAAAIVNFLTLSDSGLLRLASKDVDEREIPYWEHTKRTHRYAIRPLIQDENILYWGAETASRAMNIWFSTLQNGYLPADFNWPSVKPFISKIKKEIENRLETKTEEIFRRYTSYVVRGMDFYRKFRSENFEDVGDFDVLAYWPETNTLVFAECKYNQPVYSVKDSRRLRDKIFGVKGHLSKIGGRRQFVEQHREHMLELIGWPLSNLEPTNLELYVSRDMHYWIVCPPYEVPTYFIDIDTLDNWIKENLKNRMI